MNKQRSASPDAFGGDAVGAVTPPLPGCPNCGEIAINVRIGPEFVDAPHLPAGRRLQDRLGTSPAETCLLILKFSAGFHSPGVIRWPGEHLTRRIPHARLVRVNPTHPEIPAGLAGRTSSVPVGAGHLLDALAVPHPALAGS
ncbi:hypothetical protein ACIRG4_04835 [Streptomyces sp. NPDC102395]|uniref:hypothetical protein n=1 Tax=Streptomyces sp. NPDC102395 TaxID=3366168 RepID=UPI00380AE296